MGAAWSGDENSEPLSAIRLIELLKITQESLCELFTVNDLINLSLGNVVPIDFGYVKTRLLPKDDIARIELKDGIGIKLNPLLENLNCIGESICIQHTSFVPYNKDTSVIRSLVAVEKYVLDRQNAKIDDHEEILDSGIEFLSIENQRVLDTFYEKAYCRIWKQYIYPSFKMIIDKIIKNVKQEMKYMKRIRLEYPLDYVQKCDSENCTHMATELKFFQLYPGYFQCVCLELEDIVQDSSISIDIDKCHLYNLYSRSPRFSLYFEKKE